MALTTHIKRAARKLRLIPPAPVPPPRFMAENPAYNPYSIGPATYGTPRIHTWGNDGKLSIGAYTSIAKGVRIFLGGEHSTRYASTYPFSEFEDRFPTAYKQLNGKPGGHPFTKGDVNIGADVWIGHGALILSGTTIGHGAVIGAGAIVSGTVAPYSICVGNPAKHIRYRFDEPTREALLNLQWWNWPAETIDAAAPLLMSEDIPALLKFKG